MCEKTEEAAVRLIAEALREWVGNGHSPSSYSDDEALEYLVRQGVRPSSLSMDLDHLIALAHRGIAQGRL